MTPDQAKQLREPFPSEKVGKLPRVWCAACRESPNRSCQAHQKSKCSDCNSHITSAHLHLDFVGHADATDRFLEVDHEWTWEPMALDQRGLPAFDDHGGLWIRLTIAGVTRPGYGDADGKRGGNAVKEAIGDALRNASMRFGVALDLWRKEPPTQETSAARRQPEPELATREQMANYQTLVNDIEKAMDDDRLRELWQLIPVEFKADHLTTTHANELRGLITQRRDELASTDPAEPEPTAKWVTDQRRIFALLHSVKIDGDDARHEFATKTLGKTVTTFKTLTDEDHAKLTTALEGRKRAMGVKA